MDDCFMPRDGWIHMRCAVSGSVCSAMIHLRLSKARKAVIGRFSSAASRAPNEHTSAVPGPRGSGWRSTWGSMIWRAKKLLSWQFPARAYRRRRPGSGPGLVGIAAPVGPAPGASFDMVTIARKAGRATRFSRMSPGATYDRTSTNIRTRRPPRYLRGGAHAGNVWSYEARYARVTSGDIPRKAAGTTATTAAARRSLARSTRRLRRASGARTPRPATRTGGEGAAPG